MSCPASSPNGDFYYPLIFGQDGRDRITGGELNDFLYGGGGDDLLFGRDGDDLLDGGEDDDYLVGGDGIDIFYGGEGNGVGAVVDLAAGRGYGLADGERFDGMENVAGSDWDDVLSGDGNDNELSGYGGADALYGLGGDDWLWGGAEDDILTGGKGNDRLHGGGGTIPSGNDFLAGESGEDIFVFDEEWGQDEVFDFEDGIDLIEIHNRPGGVTLIDWSQLSITQDGIDILIGYGSNEIRFWGWGVQIGDFSADDFIFT